MILQRRHRALLLIVCMVVMSWIADASPASSAIRHVVLRFDERPELPGLAALEADLVRTVASNSADRIEIYRETIDSSRFGSSTHLMLLRDFLRGKWVPLETVARSSAATVG